MSGPSLSLQIPKPSYNNIISLLYICIYILKTLIHPTASRTLDSPLMRLLFFAACPCLPDEEATRLPSFVTPLFCCSPLPHRRGGCSTPLFLTCPYLMSSRCWQLGFGQRTASLARLDSLLLISLLSSPPLSPAFSPVALATCSQALALCPFACTAPSSLLLSGRLLVRFGYPQELNT